ncbi:Uncharacterized protein TCAP_03197 [Tolypocladium capitatum]|uniref:CFEM domain-containing protein n=1 Tax=Tolypocladium capitatum TaxID=45235 RepID=A0A2K3QH55_9HYPO|nr:Uncharacterized protein TCAP_03197 [Tolypocladium capitatum]
MKFAAVAALAFAALANAQSLGPCAVPCIDDIIKKDTKCDVTDMKCICKSFNAVQGGAAACILQSCGAELALHNILPAMRKLCDGVKKGGH